MARDATTDLTKRHLSGAWRVRAIRTHATQVARGVQSVNRVLIQLLVLHIEELFSGFHFCSFLFTHLLENSQCEQTIMLQALSYYHVYDKVC